MSRPDPSRAARRNHRDPGRGRLPEPQAGTKGRILHLVNDALPTASAGYTIRTHEIVLAQQRPAWTRTW